MNSCLLEIRNVKKMYGSKIALKDVSLSIAPGEIVSLLGVNGAGKTTLSAIIASLRPVSAGDVLFLGNSIYSNITLYRQYIGYCPQRPNLNPLLTLRQNLIFSARYYGVPEDVIAIRINELSSKLELTPYLDGNSSVLSGGYKQRFMIARSIMHSPKLVILDEPTVALDPHVRHQIWNIIKEMKQAGISILLTTHYLDEAEILSDRVCVLDKGVVRLIDSPKNLMNDFKKNKLEEVFLQLIQTNQ